MEPKTLPITHDEENVVTGDPKLDLPPYTGEGEDLAAKWYGILNRDGEAVHITEEDIKAVRNEWEQEWDFSVDPPKFLDG